MDLILKTSMWHIFGVAIAVVAGVSSHRWPRKPSLDRDVDLRALTTRRISAALVYYTNNLNSAADWHVKLPRDFY